MFRSKHEQQLQERMIVKAFVEFRHETSYTKSSSHAELETWLKMVSYWAGFRFIGLFCYKALTIKVEQTCKKMLFKGSSYNMPKVKNYFFG